MDTPKPSSKAFKPILAMIPAVLVHVAPMFGQVSFTTIPVSPTTGVAVVPTAVSGDGSIVAAYDSYGHTYRWMATSGLEDIGSLPGATHKNGPVSLSADGSTIVGSDAIDVFPNVYKSRAFRWTAANGMRDLGVPVVGGNSDAHAVSGDGSVVVGSGNPPPLVCGTVTYTAYNWSLSAGWQYMQACEAGSPWAWCSGVSGDGSVVVGAWTSGGFAPSHAWRCVGSGPIQDLGVPAAGDHAYSVAEAISLDGSTVIGEYGAPLDSNPQVWFQRPFRWTVAGGFEDLGALPGAGSNGQSWAYGVSADGSLVVGSGSSSVPGEPHAFLWSESMGLVDLNSYLPAVGVDLGGSTLRIAHAISADGSTIVGSNEGGHGWVVQLATSSWPTPWPSVGDGLPGGSGLPALVGMGDLTAGSHAVLSLVQAAPSAPAALFVGATGSLTRFKGGTLVPMPPLLVLPLTTSPTGPTVLSFTWPIGLPSGFSLYYQYAVMDGAAVQGVALSNSLYTVTP